MGNREPLKIKGDGLGFTRVYKQGREEAERQEGQRKGREGRDCYDHKMNGENRVKGTGRKEKRRAGENRRGESEGARE